MVAANSILRDWVKGQIMAVETGLTEFRHVFLPYMVNLGRRDGWRSWSTAAAASFWKLPDEEYGPSRSRTATPLQYRIPPLSISAVFTRPGAAACARNSTVRSQS